MKVVHITTVIEGGAARAAIRLHNGLLGKDVSSHILHLQKQVSSKTITNCVRFTPNEPKKSSLLLRITKEVIKTIVPLIIKKREERQNDLLLKLKKKYDYDIFTFPETNYKLEKHPLVKEADIIHLHWVANFIDYSSFFKNVSKPIVWTFHDRNPFLGGVHLEIDYYRNPKSFQKIDNYFRHVKYNGVKQHSNISIICPSKSLASETKKRALFKNAPISVIPNSIENGFDNQFSKTECREELQLPPDVTILSFIGSSAFHKGLDLLLEAAVILNRQDVLFLIIGVQEKEVNLNKKLSNVKFLGQINNDKILSKIYKSSDATIITSREDNLPNVMLESWSCGIPVLSTPIGGMKDYIKPGITGLISKDLTSDSIAETILIFKKNKKDFTRSIIKKQYDDNFSMDRQTNSYSIIYKSLVPQLIILFQLVMSI